MSEDQFDGAAWRTSFYGVDGHGSVRYLTDLAGNITDTYDYDAFGNLIARSSSNPQLPTPNNYLFAGEQFDPDLGLYYLRSRYAEPGRGRFWTADSFGGFADDPPSLHRYTFNQNDPVNGIDPSGHFTLAEVGTVVGMNGWVQQAIQRPVRRRQLLLSRSGRRTRAEIQHARRSLHDRQPGGGTGLEIRQGGFLGDAAGRAVSAEPEPGHLHGQEAVLV